MNWYRPIQINADNRDLYIYPLMRLILTSKHLVSQLLCMILTTPSAVSCFYVASLSHWLQCYQTRKAHNNYATSLNLMYLSLSQQEIDSLLSQVHKSSCSSCVTSVMCNLAESFEITYCYSLYNSCLILHNEKQIWSIEAKLESMMVVLCNRKFSEGRCSYTVRIIIN